MSKVGYWAGKKRPMSEITKQRIAAGHRGLRLSDETKKKIGDSQRGQKSVHWKEEGLGYSGLHLWLVKEFGKATNCIFEDESCKGCFDWANIRGKYVRDINEFMGLCRSHHVRYDKGTLNYAGDYWLEGLRK